MIQPVIRLCVSFLVVASLLPAPSHFSQQRNKGGGEVIPVVTCCEGKGASCLFGTAGSCIARCRVDQGCTCSDAGCVLGFPVTQATCKCN